MQKVNYVIPILMRLKDKEILIKYFSLTTIMSVKTFSLLGVAFSHNVPNFGKELR